MSQWGPSQGTTLGLSERRIVVPYNAFTVAASLNGYRIGNSKMSTRPSYVRCDKIEPYIVGARSPRPYGSVVNG